MEGANRLAKPLFGTTATHAACLFAAWGNEKAKAYFRAIKANGAQVFSGNKQVAQAVGSGAIAIGMTDTDDAMGRGSGGAPGRDHLSRLREEGGVRTPFVPNTVVLIKGVAPIRTEAADVGEPSA